MKASCFLRRTALSMLSALALAHATASAHGALIAEFVLKDRQNFAFKNNAETSDLSSNLIKVTFRYKVANTYGAINQAIDAELTLVSLVRDKAVNVAGDITQPMDFIFLGALAETAVAGKNQLMTGGPFLANAPTGAIKGRLNASSALFDAPANDSPSEPTFVSDFLNFDDFTNLGVQIDLNPLSRGLAINANGYLEAFTSGGRGQIFGTPRTALVPEPTSLALVALGLAPFLALACRPSGRRRPT